MQTNKRTFYKALQKINVVITAINNSNIAVEDRDLLWLKIRHPNSPTLQVTAK
jgi:hypothetical protein